ncbi:MAG TPA: hypothetical protein P5230_00225 [Candidatus Magasanikbacteria bacterium]|nr:hypothetical protein [Candidatus Magasanikbacteria bacterium]
MNGFDYFKGIDPTIPVEKCKKCGRGFMMLFGEIPRVDYPFIPPNEEDPVLVNLSLRKPGEDKEKLIAGIIRLFYRCNCCGNKENTATGREKNETEIIGKHGTTQPGDSLEME